MNKQAPDFDILAAGAAELNAEDAAMGPLEPHWSDDPRYDSKAHYERVKAGLEVLPHPNEPDRSFDPHIGRETDHWTQDGWCANRDPSGVRNDL